MKQIPILDLKRQLKPIRAQINAAVTRVIDGAHFVFGEDIAEFETKAAAYTHAKFAFGVSNGTDALRLCLVAAGIGPGDRVVCPAFTYFATAGAVTSIGVYRSLLILTRAHTLYLLTQ